MGRKIEIGVVTQPEIPKNLEELVGKIFRVQLRKMREIVGQENLMVHGSVVNRCLELACVAALEEGLSLSLAPYEENSVLLAEENNIRRQVFDVLAKQEKTELVERPASQEAILALCDVLFLVFDRSDPAESDRFAKVMHEIFRLNSNYDAEGKLVIAINSPKVWTVDADEEVHFEYLVRSPGSGAISSEIEIPDSTISRWTKQIMITLQ